MYEDRYGFTEIKKECDDMISISREDHGKPKACLLRAVNSNKPQYSLIELDKEQGTLLRDWLDKWLNDEEIK